MTQVVLLLNQVLLLPVQIRVWGTDTTAYWISVMAVANLTSIADFGLRAAGHAELIRHTNDPEDHKSRNEFAQLWAWIRILITATTVVLLIGDFVYHHVYRGQPFALWREALIVGVALEVLLSVRIQYLDSQGYYREAEAGYLVLAAMRLFLALGALLIFKEKAGLQVLGWIWFPHRRLRHSPAGPALPKARAPGPVRSDPRPLFAPDPGHDPPHHGRSVLGLGAHQRAGRRAHGHRRAGGRHRHLRRAAGGLRHGAADHHAIVALRLGRVSHHAPQPPHRAGGNAPHLHGPARDLLRRRRPPAWWPTTAGSPSSGSSSTAPISPSTR